MADETGAADCVQRARDEKRASDGRRRSLKCYHAHKNDPRRRAKKNERHKVWREANPEKVRANNKKWSEANSTRKSAYNKAWRAANDDANRARKREHYRANKDRRLTAVAAWRTANRERIAANDRKRDKAQKAAVNAAWRAANPDYASARYGSDVDFNIRTRLRSRIAAALASKGVRTGPRILKLLGCTVDEARAHLESLFKPGMSWANRREWHIDHIKPLSRFDLHDPDQQALAFHYTNLQPLWPRENLTKSARWNPLT